MEKLKKAISHEKEKKQYRARNVCWNKHFTNVWKSNKINEIIPIADDYLNKLKTDTRIKYCIFSLQQTENQKKENSFHFQGYLEFNKLVDITAFKKAFQMSDTQNRKGTQQQAVNYVKREETRIYDKFFELGKPKGNIKRYNTEDREIPDNLDDQRILLDQRLENDEYEKFEDIKKDFTLLFLKYTKWCKNLWERYNPLKILDVKPLKTIWIYGPSGIGKSFLTNKLLKKWGYKNNDIAFKKASSETNPKLWFNLDDENKKVLWIEEVRLNFPHYNDMIQFIDKRDYLPVKGSMIKNTYDLLIVNSLLSPEEVYCNIPNNNRIEILRRLYKGNNSLVWELIKDIKSFNKLINRTKQIPNILKSNNE